MNEKVQAGDLLAYNAGHADPATRRRIDADAALRQQAAAIARLEQLAQRVPLARPDALTLAEFALGTLDSRQQAAVERFLAQIDGDDPELLLWQQWQQRLALQAQPRQPAMAQQERSRWRDLLLRLTPVNRQPAPALRGDGPQIETYRADAVQLIVQTRPSKRLVAGWQLLAMAVGLEHPIDAVQLYNAADAEPVAAELQINGTNLAIDSLPPAVYDFVIEAGDVRLHVENVRVGAEH